jgi:hypothetical protein
MQIKENRKGAERAEKKKNLLFCPPSAAHVQSEVDRWE